MAHKLKDIYPGRVLINPDNPDGTFQNRALGINETLYERRWVSDLWGFGTKLLSNASILQNNSEENLENHQIFDALDYRIKQQEQQYKNEYTLDDITATVNTGPDYGTITSFKALATKNRIYPGGGHRYKVTVFMTFTIIQNSRGVFTVLLSSPGYSFTTESLTSAKFCDGAGLAYNNGAIIPGLKLKPFLESNSPQIIFWHASAVTDQYSIVFTMNLRDKPPFYPSPSVYPPI